MAQLSKKNFVKSQKVQDTFKPPILTKENIEKVLGVSVTPSSSNKPSSKTSSISSKSKNNSIKRVLSIELSFEEPNPQSNYSDISYRMNEPADNFDYLNFVKNLSHGTIMNDTIYSTPLVDRYDESEDIFTPSETPVQNDEIKVFSQNEKEKASEDSGFPLSQEILNSKEPRRKKDKKVKQNLVNKNASKENDDESDENSTLPLHEKMLLIQESRNVGLYCLCDSCDKARYLPDIKDPLDLPTKWYCSMNPDPNHNKCSDPEEVLEDEEFLIENLFNTGSIVWAKMDGYPWWPAMVEDDPITEEYFWFEKEDADSKPTYYHVTFFDSYDVRTAWLHKTFLKPFKINMTINPQFKIPRFNKFQSRVEFAFKQAQDAVNLSLIDRLKKYSYYTKPLLDKVVPKKASKRVLQPEKQGTEETKKRKVCRELLSSDSENSNFSVILNNMDWQNDNINLNIIEKNVQFLNITIIFCVLSLYIYTMVLWF